MTVALQKWADHIEDLVFGRKAGKIAQFPKRK
jgi:hypothetical protein